MPLIDTESFAQGLRRLAQAGVTAAAAAHNMQEAMMRLTDVTQTEPLNQDHATLNQYLEGRHLMIVRRDDVRVGYEMVCRICGARVLFLPEHSLRARAPRITFDQIDAMAEDHRCPVRAGETPTWVPEEQPDLVRMIRFRRRT